MWTQTELKAKTSTLFRMGTRFNVQFRNNKQLFSKEQKNESSSSARCDTLEKRCQLSEERLSDDAAFLSHCVGGVIALSSTFFVCERLRSVQQNSAEREKKTILANQQSTTTVSPAHQGFDTFGCLFWQVALGRTQLVFFARDAKPYCHCFASRIESGERCGIPTRRSGKDQNPELWASVGLQLGGMQTIGLSSSWIGLLCLLFRVLSCPYSRKKTVKRRQWCCLWKIPNMPIIFQRLSNHLMK